MVYERPLIKVFVAYRSVFDLEAIPIFILITILIQTNTSRPVNLAVVHWLVNYEDENEYGNDNGNVIKD